MKALKRACCKSERKWRKTKLQDDYSNYRELRIRRSKQLYFSQIITENLNNSKFLFSTIDNLVNPPRTVPAESLPQKNAMSLPLFFNLKDANIRNNIGPLCAAQTPHFTTPQCHTVFTLSNFNPIQSDDLQKVVQRLSSATCALDAMPTKFFKGVFNCLVDDVLEIVNTSLLTGLFPTILEHATVIPLLKKTNLGRFIYYNYRPISKLPFLGKILEKVYQKLCAFVTKQCI